MAYGMDVPDGSVRQLDAKIELEVRFLPNGPLYYVPDPLPVLRENAIIEWM
jgi:hypothetical protein